MEEIFYQIHNHMVIYRPIFYGVGSLMTLFILTWMLYCEVQNDNEE